MLMNIKRILFGTMVFIFIRPLSYLFYDKKYLRGKYFQHIYSIGWYWTLRGLFFQKILGFNRELKWPASCRITAGLSKNIEFHPDDLNNFQGMGLYIQALGKVKIGRGTYIGPNVGLVSTNHKLDNLDEHEEPENITIGENCWLGMNCVILPGVTLGEKTIVGAGAVVTKSFPRGHCIIGGNPAKIIKYLNMEAGNNENGKV